MRVYLSGPVAGLADLGISLRAVADRALRERGCEPVWPFDVGEVHAGRLTAGQAVARWREGSGKSNCYDVQRQDLDLLATCDVVLVCGFPPGKGTLAEVYAAAWFGIPVVFWTMGEGDNDVRRAFGPVEIAWYAGLDSCINYIEELEATWLSKS